MKIRIFKTINGDEIIGTIMKVEEKSNTFVVEYPFLLHTEIEPVSQSTYTNLVPYVFGADICGPFSFSAHSVSMFPVKPKQSVFTRYQQVVEAWSQQAASAAVATKKTTLKPVGNKLKKD